MFIDSQASQQPPRQFSKISVLFFQEQPFYNLSGSICSSNRHKFSRRVYIMFFEQTRIFQEGLSKRHVFSWRLSVRRTDYYLIEQILIFPETLIYTSNTYKFSRSLYFLIEQILIFQEALSNPRTPTIFQEGTPSNRYFVNRSRWLFSASHKLDI